MIILHGKQYYTKEEYFDENVSGYLAYKYLPANSDDIVLDSDGKPYIPADTPKTENETKILKTTNVTGTYDFSMEPTFSNGIQQYLLGNNGRINVEANSISVKKEWYGEGTEPVQVQLYADGVPFRDPVELNEDNNWQYTWQDILPYTWTPDDNGNVSPITYTISELNVPSNYTADYIQPIFNANTDTWSAATIRDIEKDALVIKKEFNGIDKEDEPNDLEFTIIGKNADGEQIYNETIPYSDFTNNEYILPGLDVGTYTITETGGDVPGYTKTSNYPDGTSVEVNDTNEAIVKFVNTYKRNLDIEPIPGDNSNIALAIGIMIACAIGYAYLVMAKKTLPKKDKT